MSSGGKIDQSLEDIITKGKGTGRARRTARPNAGRRPSAPVGGIQKSAKPARGNAAKPVPAKAPGKPNGSKVMVSNLPKDVSESQIKDYFQQAVGQVKKVDLSYGPGGVSRGIASVIFSHSDGASKAFQELNGLLIDNRPVKVEVVVAQVDQIPQPKTLGERLSQPRGQAKVQPKSAAANKHNAANNKAGAKKDGAKKERRGRNARPHKKTQEELDAEMVDYMATAPGIDAAAPAAAGAGGAPAAAPANNGDASMEDEIM